ncbi:MAG: metallophosphoesterase [Opitutaceae bacterium]|jgi:hypothetical protein|nr:metallophosphoesterase [Opitutaceae bacterium]
MQRRHFLATLGALTAASALPSKAAVQQPAARQPAATTDDGPLLLGSPAVFAPTASSLSITVPLRAPAFVRIEHGPTPKLGNLTNGTPWGFVPHDDSVVKITLADLPPGARRHWRALLTPLNGGDTQSTPVYSHKTLDPSAPSTRFSVWNDTHDNAPTLRKLHSLLDPDDDFLLWNGDASNNINDPAIIAPTYVSPRGLNLALAPAILFARGNHDVRGRWANKLNNHLAFPGNRPFCAFRSGPLAAILLDTGEDKPDAHPSFRGTAAFEPLIREQAAWLGNVIRQPEIRDAPYRVVFCHIPLRWTDETPPDYANKGFDHVSLRGRAAWEPALLRWGVQLVISAHNHRASRLPPSPRHPYTQILGGGPKLEAATLMRCHADASALRLTVTKIKDNSTVIEETLPPHA